MGHFKLYQYVFNKSRDVQNAKVHLQVETPPEPRQFTEGKDVSIWEYEQKIQQIEQTEKERKNERENEQEVSRKQHDEVISDALQDLETEGQPMDREVRPVLYQCQNKHKDLVTWPNLKLDLDQNKIKAHTNKTAQIL